MGDPVEGAVLGNKQGGKVGLVGDVLLVGGLGQLATGQLQGGKEGSER